MVLLLLRIEHHLLERPLGKLLLLLLVGGLGRKVALLAELGRKVRVSIVRSWRGCARVLWPLCMVGVWLSRKCVLRGRRERLAGERALAGRGRHRGRVHRVLGERQGHV